MKRILLLLLITVTISLVLKGQKRKYKWYKYTEEYRSEMVATSLNDIYIMIDKLSELIKEQNDFKFNRIWISDYSRSDTLAELLYVEKGTPKNKDYYGTYFFEMNKNLTIDQLRAIVDYSLKYHLRKTIDDYWYYTIIIRSMSGYLYKYIESDEFKGLNSVEQTKYIRFYKYCVTKFIYHYDYDCFSSANDYFLLDDDMCKIVSKQLKEQPKFPGEYLQDYWKNRVKPFNFAEFDTTGMAEYHRTTPSYKYSGDKYARIYSNLMYYDSMAKENDMTIEEVFYEQQLRGALKGYINITPIVQYVKITGDKRLLPAVREFVKDNPDYHSYPYYHKEFLGIKDTLDSDYYQSLKVQNYYRRDILGIDDKDSLIQK